MKRTIERFAFATRKYGYDLHADAGPIERWTGFVRDDRPHILDFHELLYIDNGRGSVWRDEDCVAAEAGRIIVTAAGHVRRIEVDRPSKVSSCSLRSDSGAGSRASCACHLRTTSAAALSPCDCQAILRGASVGC